MGQDIKVGTIFDHSGALKEWGVNHQNAAELAAKAKGLPLTSPNIRDQLRQVANPPGKFVGPGEFKQAFESLEKGAAINYEGASGSVDFDNNGDVLAPIEI